MDESDKRKFQILKNQMIFAVIVKSSQVKHISIGIGNVAMFSTGKWFYEILYEFMRHEFPFQDDKNEYRLFH